MTTKECPKCHSTILLADAIYCDMCGHQLPKLPTPSLPVKQWEPIAFPTIGISSDAQDNFGKAISFITCPKCSQQNEPTHHFCDHCGTKLA